MASQSTEEPKIALESTVATTVSLQESLTVQADWENSQACLSLFLQWVSLVSVQEHWQKNDFKPFKLGILCCLRWNEFHGRLG